jgi:hypothetical protein
LNGGHGFASFLLGVPQTGAITISRPLMLWQWYYCGNPRNIQFGLRFVY